MYSFDPKFDIVSVLQAETPGLIACKYYYWRQYIPASCSTKNNGLTIPPEELYSALNTRHYESLLQNMNTANANIITFLMLYKSTHYYKSDRIVQNIWSDWYSF